MSTTQPVSVPKASSQFSAESATKRMSTLKLSMPKIPSETSTETEAATPPAQAAEQQQGYPQPPRTVSPFWSLSMVETELQMM